MASGSRASEKYRRDIDGLRAVAVSSVIAFHTFPNFFKGGYVGVDVFFVISGYLIIGIIIDTEKENRFSYLDFYKRRIKRIFPSLLAVAALTLLFAWYVLLPDEFRQFGKHLASASVFVTNFSLWSESGYFDQASDTKPLLHLWSLAVEEQFYIFWPLLLSFVWKRRGGVLAATICVAAISFTYNVITVEHDPSAAFYSPLSRFWELMVGAWLACRVRQDANGISRFQTERGAFGLALIGAAVLMIRRDFTFPGYWALVPTLGAYFVISAGGEGWINRRLLGNGLMVFVGLISYSLYLWHWPILVLAKLTKGALLTPAERGATIAVAIALASLTYQYIERPLRRSPGSGVPQGLVLAAAVVGAFGLVIFSGGLRSRLDSEQLTPILAAKVDWEYPPVATENHSFGPLRYFTEHSELDGYTLYVGDSNMEQYAPRIDWDIKNNPSQLNGAIFVGNQEGCGLIGEVISGVEHCASAMPELKRLMAQASTKAVTIAMSWLSYDRPLATAEGRQHLIEFLRSITKSKRAYLVLNMPAGDELSPAGMVTGSRLGTLLVKPLSDVTFDLARFEAKYARLNGVLAAIGHDSGASIVDPVAVLCPNRQCPVFDDHGKPLYLDASHMTRSYATRAASYIDRTLRPADTHIGME